MTTRPFDVAGTGFTVLDRVYVGDGEPSESLGGSCGNVLLSLALLRRSVIPVLRLGRDDVGRRLFGAFALAGAATDLIFQHEYVASPILAQHLEPASGQHWFSFVCPLTSRDYPRYSPVGDDEIRLAGPALRGCSVFYADRLSPAIATAMEIASAAGAAVFFEPSDIDDDELFERALASTTVLKYSADRFGDRLVDVTLAPSAIRIVTHGSEGLQVSQDNAYHLCAAIPAAEVRDTCGSGDMVSVGLIDRMLSCCPASDRSWPIDSILEGVRAGQRLATANCGHIGARGLFTTLGADVARSVLDGRSGPNSPLVADSHV